LPKSLTCGGAVKGASKSAVADFDTFFDPKWGKPDLGAPRSGLYGLTAAAALKNGARKLF
jgi:hypothetical protein